LGSHIWGDSSLDDGDNDDNEDEKVAMDIQDEIDENESK
jgi:hypothetical protein